MRRTTVVVTASLALLASACTSTTVSPPPPDAPPSARPRATPSGDPSAQATPEAHHAWPPRPRVSRLHGRLPRPLAREAVSLDPRGSLAVVAGGLLQTGATTPSTYSLDLDTGRSSPLPDLATAVHDTAGSFLSGRATVIGGGNESEQSVVQARRAGRWQVIGHLPAVRSDLGVAAGSGRTFVVGGYDGSSAAITTVLGSRDGRRWRTVGRLPLPVRYPATALLGTTIWVFGGEVSGHMVDAVQRVDLTTGRSRVAGHLPVALGHSVVVRLGGQLLLAGGRTDQRTITDRLWWFRPRSVRFHPAGRLPTPLADSAAVGGRRAAYLVGGETPAFSDHVLRLRIAP